MSSTDQESWRRITVSETVGLGLGREIQEAWREEMKALANKAPDTATIFTNADPEDIDFYFSPAAAAML